MKRLIGLVLITALIVSGCTGNVVANQPTQRPTDNTPDPTQLVDKTWISPGIVEIGSFYPGAEADWFVKIHNGGDETATFKVTYRLPDNNKEGYVNAPSLARSWVTIESELVVLKAKETKEVLINLKMPVGIKSASKWEFWISVMEQTDGMIVTEMCSRWLITMK